MTKRQDKARRRNFNVMVMRGMYTQLQRIKKEHPNIYSDVEGIQDEIDTCLELLQAESQTHRLKREL